MTSRPSVCISFARLLIAIVADSSIAPRRAETRVILCPPLGERHRLRPAEAAEFPSVGHSGARRSRRAPRCPKGGGRSVGLVLVGRVLHRGGGLGCLLLEGGGGLFDRLLHRLRRGLCLLRRLVPRFV